MKNSLQIAFFAAGLNVGQAFVLPSRHRPFSVVSASLAQTKADGRPPAFSLVDDDGNDGDDDKDDTSLRIPPPDFTVEDDDEDDDDDAVGISKAASASAPPAALGKSPQQKIEEDPYTEQVSPTTAKRPKRPKRKIAPVANMVGTNWMEKNAKFLPDQDGMAMNESLPDTPEIPRRNSNSDNMKETRSRLDSKSFRQDFRGTRVFVQGISPGTSWQDLKDHFKVAGNVVFASVSVNPETGETKGHGIVQFESTSMAENAIGIMRNHPLNGSPLFVREDVQESNNPNARLSSSAPRGDAPPTSWKCANEDNAAYLSSDDLAAIQTLIKARDDARRRRKYEISDRLRDELKVSHGVFIDDRLKMWWTSIDGSKVPQSIKEIKGDGRWKLEPWRQIPTTAENDACVNADLVEGLLKQRDISRREKDFGTADSLLEEARTAPDGELTLRIHDESRTWRIWTDAPPPRPVEHVRMTGDPGPGKNRAAMECMEIVQKFAPEKIDEIKMVLRKFEGREFQVLKRLKNQYL